MHTFTYYAFGGPSLGSVDLNSMCRTVLLRSISSTDNTV